MLGLSVAHAPRRKLAPLAQVRGAPVHIMRVSCENMGAALIEHTLAPILCLSSESTSERPGSELHPNPGVDHPLYRKIVNSIQLNRSG